MLLFAGFSCPDEHRCHSSCDAAILDMFWFVPPINGCITFEGSHTLTTHCEPCNGSVKAWAFPGKAACPAAHDILCFSQPDAPRKRPNLSVWGIAAVPMKPAPFFLALPSAYYSYLLILQKVFRRLTHGVEHVQFPVTGESKCRFGWIGCFAIGRQSLFCPYWPIGSLWVPRC